jgi:hypothetical protein
MDFHDFLYLADKVIKEFEHKNLTPLDISEFLNIPEISTLRFDEINTILYRVIQDSATGSEGTNTTFFETFTQTLIFKHVHGQCDLLPYLSIFEHLADAGRSINIRGSASINWEIAIKSAYIHQMIQNWHPQPEMIRRLRQRQFEVAEASNRLNNLGFVVEIRDGKAVLTDESAERLTTKLESLVETISGINLINTLLNAMLPQYSIQQGRFHLVRQLNPLGENVSPKVPIGYLVGLAGKQLFKNPDPQKIQENYQELLRLATDFATTYDVQDYNTMDQIFKSGKGLLPYFQKMAIYDSMFTLRQLRSSDANKLLLNLFSWIDPKTIYENRWSILDITTVAAAIIHLSEQSNLPICIKPEDIISKCLPAKIRDIDVLIDQVFSHSNNLINANYRFPTDVTCLDMHFKPLFKSPDGNYWTLSSPLSSIATIESVMTFLRKSHKNFESSVGKQLENFLQNEFASHSINAFGGDYEGTQVAGECDLLIEHDEAIILFEIKKKALTRSAMSGIDTSILVDLGSSILDAQYQAGRTELILEQDGKLDLKDSKGITHTVQHSGREIEKIAISLFDFGSFQDRSITMNFLNTILGIDYHPINNEYISKFESLHETIREIREQVEISKKTGDTSRLFFSCWFLSVPQLLILLDDCIGTSAFKDRLWRNRHVCFGTMDLYSEIESSNRLLLAADHT